MLAKAAQPSEHPDVDLLNAFAERSLTPPDRGQVLEHLSGCADCREILVAALPPMEATQTPAHVPRRTGWFGWPILRWGALAACVVVVGAAVSLHYQQGSTPVSQMEPQEFRAAAPANTAPAENAEPSASSPRRFDAPPASRASAANTVTADKRDEPDALKSQSQAPQAAAAANSDNASPEKNLRTDNSVREQEQSTPAAPPALEEKAANEPFMVGALSKAKDQPRPPSQALAGAAASSGGRVAAPTESGRSQNDALRDYSGDGLIAPRWILSDGILERSLDSGKTYQPVPLSGAGVLRALTTVGTHVWVGGSGGALYHSSDGGQHWLQVKPVANGKELRADVIGLNFSDSQHGQFATSASETWTTSDGGQTWQKR